MKRTVDCLLVGHNTGDLTGYVDSLRQMGQDSGTYRDLNLAFIRVNNRLYDASGVFNLFFAHGSALTAPLRYGETFSATIAYLGTYLHRRGLTFDYVMSFREEKEALAKKLEQDNILTIAITTTLYLSEHPVIEVMDFIKAHNQKAKIIVGGPFIATQASLLKGAGLDNLFKSIGAGFYVNSSQGEAALVEIIEALKTGRPVERIHNIYYQKGREYLANELVKENNRLSENMVEWGWFADRAGEYVNTRTSISCPFSCKFCAFPGHAGEYQTAGVEEVEQELNSLAKIHRVKSIHFIDDNFNVPVKRCKELLKMMTRNRYGFKWITNIRCQFLDREMAELLETSGCEGVFLGLESGNRDILENMNKAANVEKYLEGIALLKEAGIATYGSFIAGFPGETMETAADTVRFIETSGLDFFRVQLWYCDKLTPIWQERQKYRIEGSGFEWAHATMDAKKASALIEEMFLTIERAVWVPQYNFDFNNIFHLVHRGLSLDQVKRYLKVFNKAVAEKLMKSTESETSPRMIQQIKESLFHHCGDISPAPAVEQGNPNHREKNTGLDFNFNLG